MQIILKTRRISTAQGADKAFKNEQLVLGVGTWGSGYSVKTMREIVAATPNLAYNAGSWTDGTNTWTIESREQVRAKTQLALDRNMPGMRSWTLHYDAVGTMSLHRVMDHYAMVKRGIPDLNLDGKVNATRGNHQGNADRHQHQGGRIVDHVDQVPVQMPIYDPDFEETGGENGVCDQDQSQRNQGPEQPV